MGYRITEGYLLWQMIMIKDKVGLVFYRALF
ncbi:hypothetical protein Kkor_0269 [Kangiella koreensis DSM 16069]|uniref:Uncharacterized protein n=1 Tax=Kangiella koreensis (strain DSM 16069 / JCM 12317 / KCTC 12182 / SW-125) TaxID=523791 RepID=C7R7E1_KANKD|nr:hypothetical protein Kkor_0269 [Kangiella koreensis DSM 16069]